MENIGQRNSRKLFQLVPTWYKAPVLDTQGDQVVQSKGSEPTYSPELTAVSGTTSQMPP